MEADLQYVENLDLTNSERPMFNVLKATLQYPANPQAKAIKFAHDINFFYESSDEDIEILWDAWYLVLDIAASIPSGHQWQDSLLQSLDILQKRDKPTFKHDGSPIWKDLPYFGEAVREKWFDPAGSGEDSEELRKLLSRWKNLNSFIARLARNGILPGIMYPIWQLRKALEEPPIRGPALECQIWVASEWILNYADSIFEEMNCKDEVDEDTARILRGGSLYKGKSPLSLERWSFWKNRFSELSANATSLGLDSAITTRISEALKSMDDIEA
ncbi:hypothetical protein GGR53DRAFT_515895 [Hypoxylon sp. FL1150]|nr:hypothetical protein GGR53DRAFT_515895 [Hypoxylon sp. FL1150]